MIQQQKQRHNSQRTTDSPQRLTVGEIVVAVFNLLLGGAPLALFAYVWLSYASNPPEYGSNPPLDFSQYMLIGACLSAVFAGVGILVRARALASLLLMLLAVIALVIAIAGVITLDRSSGPGIYLPLAAMAFFGLLQGLAALWLRRMQA